MKFIKLTANYRLITFIALILLAPLSKYPSLAMPLFNFPSFRIGLYQIIAVVFVLLCIAPIVKMGINFFIKSNPLAFASIITLVILAIFGLSRSLYPQRSLLMVVSFLLILAVLLCAWWFTANELSKNNCLKIINLMLWFSVIYGIIGLFQLLIFTFTDLTLGVKCPGCTAEVFGFPRINGLAAEPQFLANAMLPFVFASLYGVIKFGNKLSYIALISAIFTIGLTFSRGAYLALGISLTIIGTLLAIKKYIGFKKLLTIYLLIGGVIILSLSTLIFSAALRYNTTPNIAYETLDSITEHLTLGVINLPESRVIIIQNDSQNNVSSQDDFVSPGLIEESNQERTSAAQLTIKAWSSTIITALAGVGLGNLGPYVVNNIDLYAPKDLTVYIFYILILAELGFIGLLCLITLFSMVIWRLIKQFNLLNLLFMGLIVSFALQFMFFGSHINVVYIWLWLGIALGITSVNPAVNPKKRYTKD